MAVTTSKSATIRGIKYSRGSSFKCAKALSGATSSEGAGSASALTAGTTYYFYSKASGDNVSHPYAVSSTSGASPRGWYTEDVFPFATYSVKYNANGGSGAPSGQTKTYGKTLTLSSTKPTRTGYTFQGWGTTASDTSVNYAAGASYTANAAITLYAIWKANTYTISFNANGGSGAPSSVTKTYGKTLTLPLAVPTRGYYKFLGWSASSSASAATYSAGGSYTSNANATLYAVWAITYEKPTISNLKAIRCDADGKANDFGTYARVKFNWGCSQALGANAVSSITVDGTSVSASGTSGTVSAVVGGSLSIETAHQISVVVVDTLKSDGYGKTAKNVGIPAAIFAIDFKEGGKGVAFGKPAEREGFMEIAHPTVISNNQALYYLNTAGEMRSAMTHNGSNNLHFGAGSYDNADGSVYFSGNNVYHRSKGATNVDASGGVIFSSGTTLHLQKTTDVGTDKDVEAALVIGSKSGQHMVFDTNEIVSKAGPTEGGAIYLVGTRVGLYQDDGYILVNDKRAYLCQYGSVSITPTAANTVASKAVTFPYAFKATPAVTVCPASAVPGSSVKGYSASNQSSTGFTAHLYRSNTTATTIHWIACGQI